MTYEEALKEMKREDELKRKLGPIPKLYFGIAIFLNFGFWYVFRSLIF